MEQASTGFDIVQNYGDKLNNEGYGILTTCPSPVCTCRDITFSVFKDRESSEPGGEKAVLKVDLRKRRYEVISTASENYCSTITDCLWEQLDVAFFRGKYFQLKKFYREYAQAAYINPFSNTSMISLVELYSSALGIHFMTPSGEKFFISDYHCGNADCDCEGMAFFVYRFHQKRIYRKRVLFSAHVNITKNQIDISTHSNIEKGTAKTIIESFLKVPGLLDYLKERRQLLLDIIKEKERTLISKTYEDAPNIREEPKIGRNEPCPCGSGKKYKKCCLNK